MGELLASPPRVAAATTRARVVSIAPSDPLRSAAVLWLVGFVVLVGGALVGWAVLDVFGVVGRAEALVGDMVGAERFAFSTGAVALVVVALGVVGASFLTLAAGALLLVSNAVARLSGGVVVDLAERP
jgi:hypothetical protein